MILGHFITEGLVVFPRCRYRVTELLHERRVVISHKLGQVIPQAVDLAAKYAVGHAGIIIDRIGRNQSGQVKREIVGRIGHARHKPRLCKDHIRPTLVCIIEEQDF
jgi:hypothetical protein